MASDPLGFAHPEIGDPFPGQSIGKVKGVAKQRSKGILKGDLQSLEFQAFSDLAEKEPVAEFRV